MALLVECPVALGGVLGVMVEGACAEMRLKRVIGGPTQRALGSDASVIISRGGRTRGGATLGPSTRRPAFVKGVAETAASLRRARGRAYAGRALAT